MKRRTTRRITLLLASILMVLGLTVATAPAASALVSQVYAYKHANMVEILWYNDMGINDCNDAGYTFNYPMVYAQEITSLRAGILGQMRHCNYLEVMNWDGAWTGRCIQRATSPLNDTMAIANVGPGWNDNVWRSRVRYHGYCYLLNF